MISKKTKIDYSTFDLASFHFRDERISKNFLTTVYRFLIGILVGNDWLRSPILQPENGVKIGIQKLGSVIGFNNPVQQDLISFHHARLKIHYYIDFSIYFLIALSLTIPLVFFVPRLINWSAFSLFSIPIIILYVFVAAGIAIRLSYSVTIRYFSDSFCVQTIIFLIIELAHYKNPLRPFQKRNLLKRTGFLVKATHSLASYYNLGTSNRIWAVEHFRQIENFIHEREKWIIASKDSTLEDLRQDFYHLALIGLTQESSE